MDTFAHGFWALILFFKHPLRNWAFLFAMLPDIIAFAPHILLEHWLRLGHGGIIGFLYPLTHSLLIMPVLFTVLFFLIKKPIFYVAAGAWASHIILDLFTHTQEFYPTQYFYPFHSPFLIAADYTTVTFTVINYALILTTMILLLRKEKNLKKKSLKK